VDAKRMDGGLTALDSGSSYVSYRYCTRIRYSPGAPHAVVAQLLLVCFVTPLVIEVHWNHNFWSV